MRGMHKKIGVGLLVTFTVLVVLLELYVLKNMAEYRVQDNVMSEIEGTSELVKEMEDVSSLASETEEPDKLVSKAEDAKISFLQNKEFIDDFMFLEEVRYQEAYVNADDIPELFLCQGNGHVDNVLLYSYREDENIYQLTGEFSEYGKLSYLPGTGDIRSMYGGMGCFYWVTFKWHGAKEFELVHSCANIHYGKELYLYENYPVPAALIDPELECHGEWTFMQDEYLVSELSCEDEDDEFIQVSYDEMMGIE